MPIVSFVITIARGFGCILEDMEGCRRWCKVMNGRQYKGDLHCSDLGRGVCLEDSNQLTEDEHNDSVFDQPCNSDPKQMRDSNFGETQINF